MNNLEELEIRFKEMTSELDSLNGRYNLLKEQIDNSEEKLKELNHKKEVFTKSIELLTFISEVTKQKIKVGFESLITYALRYVFNEDYKFLLEFDRRGNLQEIDFKILPPDRSEANDPLDTMGCGVLDVVSFALRIIAMELSKPKVEGFIGLDESFKHLSTCYLPNAYKLLKEINKKTKRQIIFVTHQGEFIDYADKAIKIGT